MGFYHIKDHSVLVPGPGHVARQAVEAHLRNLRFRAWRRVGVPVAAYWFEHGGWYLHMRCLAPRCGWTREGGAREVDILADVEAARLIGVRGTRRCCDHLLPLAGICSEAQLALFELELIAHG